MMNHIVPDFETDDDDFMIPELPNKSTMGGDEDIMELLWHNGQVVMQSQNQRSVGSKKAETRPSTAATASREIRSSVVEEETRPSGMFMQEDEMASWLHYPIDDNPLENYLYVNDLIYPPPSSSAPIAAAPTSLPPPPPPSVMIPSRPPVPPYRRTEAESVQPKNTNFVHFTRPNKSRSPELGPSVATKSTPVIQLATIVASNDTPMAKASESRASRVSDKPVAVSAGFNGGGWSTSGVGAAGASSAVREIETCELSVTSSPGSGGSGASASMEPLCQKPPPVSNDRKRKGIDADDNDCHSEDVEFEYADAKKQSHAGSTSTKRSRAAEVHNLSERRRRDRINEKMKALQELIPRCNKSDKASMLDEAIEYLKSLQMQVQMMSMGCNMVPMMYPGVQQYMPPMAMSMGMGMGMAGMGMGMDMGMNRAMVPYPAILPGSSLPNPAAAAAAAAAHLGQRFPVSGFNMSPVTVAGPTASQAANMPDPMMNPLILNSQNQPRVPNFADPFQQHLGLHQAQLPLPQNQGRVPPIATKPSSSKDTTNPDHHQTR